MIKVKEIMSNTRGLDENINIFIKKNNITKDELIDIKYITVDVPTAVRTSALIIYDRNI